MREMKMRETRQMGRQIKTGKNPGRHTEKKREIRRKGKWYKDQENQCQRDRCIGGRGRETYKSRQKQQQRNRENTLTERLIGCQILTGSERFHEG